MINVFFSLITTSTQGCTTVLCHFFVRVGTRSKEEGGGGRFEALLRYSVSAPITVTHHSSISLPRWKSRHGYFYTRYISTSSNIIVVRGHVKRSSTTYIMNKYISYRPTTKVKWIQYDVYKATADRKSYPWFIRPQQLVRTPTTTTVYWGHEGWYSIRSLMLL